MIEVTDLATISMLDQTERLSLGNWDGAMVGSSSNSPPLGDISYAIKYLVQACNQTI